jgi:hypothetical protein
MAASSLNSAYDRMVAARAAIRDHQNESDFNRAIMDALMKVLHAATDQYIAELSKISQRKPASPATTLYRKRIERGVERTQQKRDKPS